MTDLPSGVTRATRHGGDVIDVVTPRARSSIALQGAHVLSYWPDGQSHDILWCSPLSPLGGGKAIRGGIPLCWPWFGPHASEPALPQHGIARTVPWTLQSASRNGDDVTLTFALPASDATRRYGLAATVAVHIDNALTIHLDTHNTGTTNTSLTTALHTYLRVGDIGRIAIDGLDGATYRDNTDGGRATAQSGPMHIARETIALFDTAPAKQTVSDPVLKRRICVERIGGTSTIVWNPGANASTMADIPQGAAAEFVCVESGAIGAAAVSLAPGGTHRLTTRITVEPL